MRIELLPINRWGELKRALEESRSDESIPKPSNSIILSANDGGEMVGCIGAERVWLVSPFWVKKELRGSSLAPNLATNLADYNLESLREVCVTTSSHVEKLIFGLGFRPIEGQLWRRDRGE